MDRRSFVRALGCLRLVAPLGSRFYTFQTFNLKPGSQSPIPNGWSGIYFEALMAPSMPQMLAIHGANSLPAKMSDNSTILQPAPHSIDIRTAAADNARIFELRVYNSGPAIEILHRSGIKPILYSSTTYLVPFDSLAAREKAWTVFSADPDWIELRKSSRVQAISLWKAANIGITSAVLQET